MKKSSIIVLTVVAVIALLAVIYRAVNNAPSASLTANEQVVQVLTDGGCASCHSMAPDLPFYAHFPVIKGMINKHVQEGYATFDILPFMRTMKDESVPNEVDLNKVEQCIIDGSMPMKEYYLVHWGSSITPEKRDRMLAAIKSIRARYFHNPLAAPEFVNEPVRPLPDSIAYHPQKAALGKLLYHDTRLSADGTVSCATCHGLNTAGVDNKRYSEGIKGQLGGVNAPTVYNACFNFAQFWEDFIKVYPEGLSQATITDAISEFEKTLVTPNSAFDRYLKGEKSAMTDEQIAGYNLFKQYSCSTCHAGASMGGLSYELMGQRANYFEDRELTQKSGLTDGDNGRWAQTKVERDRYRFKTPTLRNVALTYPYYHDGSVETLNQAITMMAKYQVGQELSPEEAQKIEAFLNALTGEYEGKTLTNSNMNK